MHVLLAFPVPFHALAETIEAALGIRDQLVESSLCGRGLLLRVPRFLALGLCAWDARGYQRPPCFGMFLVGGYQLPLACKIMSAYVGPLAPQPFGL